MGNLKHPCNLIMRGFAVCILSVERWNDSLVYAWAEKVVFGWCRAGVGKKRGGAVCTENGG